MDPGRRTIRRLLESYSFSGEEEIRVQSWIQAACVSCNKGARVRHDIRKISILMLRKSESRTVNNQAVGRMAISILH